MTPIPKPCGCCCMGTSSGYAKRWIVVLGAGTGCFAKLNDGILCPYVGVDTVGKACTWECTLVPGFTVVRYRHLISNTGTFIAHVQASAILSPGFRVASGTTPISAVFACGAGAYGVTPTIIGGTPAAGTIAGLLYGRFFRRIDEALSTYPNLHTECRP